MKAFWLVLALVVSGMTASAESLPGAFYVNYDAVVPAAPLRLHAVSIVHPDARVDLAAAHAAGNRVLAYLSVGEIAADARYRPQAVERGLPLRGQNQTWGSDLIDLSDARWTDLLVGEVAAAAAAKGFDGYFLDTLDSVAASDRAAAVALVKRLRADNPGAMIVANRGFEMLPELRGVVDGVMAESIWATYDFERRQYREVPAAETAALVARLRDLKAAGWDVFALDYVAPTDEARAREVATRMAEEGWRAFVSTPALRGAALAPWREVPRRVFSFYGNLAIDPADRIVWPADSFTGLRLQAALEWLGYEVDFARVEAGGMLPELGPETAAIVLPRLWEYPLSEEGRVVDWLIAQVAAGKRLLVFGQLPFNDDAQRVRLMKALGLRGSGDLIMPVNDLREVASDEAILAGAEIKGRLLPTEFIDLQAPTGSRVMRAVAGVTPAGREVRVDALFSTSWGGVALDPYVFFQRPDMREFWQFDVFAFLEATLGRVAAPLPDATTRDGRRMFLSHIDGDGFINRSEVSVGQYSAEVVRDRILKRYPVPVTVSVIEAEVRVLVEGTDPALAPQFEAIARDIFALPNVEMASHSHSHPFSWMADDRTASLYEHRNLQLRIAYPHVSMEREVDGSVAYINRELAPPGKQVEVFLWSGNCRPGIAALQRVRALGLVSLNGGDTIISRRVPSLNAVAPRTMPWGDELQVLAPAQNENVYTNNWEGPFFGTFVNVIDTFQRTETPRRLKPVNIYYHFYSGDYFSSVQALETIHDWAIAQPLHAVKASTYARLAMDARHTHMYSKGGDSWALVNAGDLRTYRVPAAWAERIDLRASPRVTGWVVEGEEAYLHTDGSPVVDVVLAPAGRTADRAPRLATSTGEVTALRRTARSLSLTVADLRPVTIETAGWPGSLPVRVVVDGREEMRTTTPDGGLVLQVAPVAQVGIFVD